MENTPEVINTYFDAKNARDRDPFIASFATDAKVVDENKIYVGTAEIWEWAKDTAKKYNEISTITSYKEEDGKSVVTANVAGSFDGSPIELTYLFELDDSKIVKLEIG